MIVFKIMVMIRLTSMCRITVCVLVRWCLPSCLLKLIIPGCATTLTALAALRRAPEIRLLSRKCCVLMKFLVPEWLVHFLTDCFLVRLDETDCLECCLFDRLALRILPLESTIC